MRGLLAAHEEIEGAERRQAMVDMRTTFWAEPDAFDRAVAARGGPPAPDDGTAEITNL